MGGIKISYKMPGNNFNQKNIVHDIYENCRTIIGVGSEGYHSGNEPKVLVRGIEEMNKITNLYKSKGQNGNVYDWNGRSPTILSGVTDNSNNGGIGSNNSPKIITYKGDKEMNKDKKFRIRKLTPEECFVLQGMNLEDVSKCRDIGISNTQLYKQAGNGLTTNCVQFLMEHLYKCLYDKTYQTTDETMSEKYGA